MSREQSSNPQFTGELAAETTTLGHPAAVMQAAETVAGQIKPKVGRTTVTIGDALEAVARTAGDKPIDRCEAAAIKVAEYRATGSSLGELASMAESAVAFNDALIGDQGKVKLADILTGARAKLPADKVSTFEDAEEVLAAGLRYMSRLPVDPSEVATAVMEAVRTNVRGRYVWHT